MGQDNFFLFGLTAEEVALRRQQQPEGRAAYDSCEELREVVDLIADGFLSYDEPELFRGLMEAMLEDDHYMVFADFASYADCQRRLAEAYQNRMSWARMAGLNIARIGRFSSDRTIQQYADEIWGIRPLKIPLPEQPGAPGA